jgi:hypothetical protein
MLDLRSKDAKTDTSVDQGNDMTQDTPWTHHSKDFVGKLKIK